jgi:hypothetical protein
VTTFTGEYTRNEGKRCHVCKSTEARCAFAYGSCCPACSHWKNWTPDGEPILTSTAVGGRPLAPVVDAVTAKRREQWRNRKQRKAS